jgi:hypothetical protein
MANANININTNTNINTNINMESSFMTPYRLHDVDQRFSKFFTAHGRETGNEPFDLLTSFTFPVEVIMFSSQGQSLYYHQMDKISSFINNFFSRLDNKDLRYYDGRKYRITPSPALGLSNMVKIKIFSSEGSRIINPLTGDNIEINPNNTKCPELVFGANDPSELTDPGFIGVYNPQTVRFTPTPPGSPIPAQYLSGKETPPDMLATSNIRRLIRNNPLGVNIRNVIQNIYNTYTSFVRNGILPGQVLRLFVVSCSAPPIVAPGEPPKKRRPSLTRNPFGPFRLLGNTLNTRFGGSVRAKKRSNKRRNIRKTRRSKK